MHAERAYLFRHALMRDAAYQLQMPVDRARLHGLALEAIQDLYGGAPPHPDPLTAANRRAAEPHPIDPFARQLAEHAVHSGAGRLACTYLARAAEWFQRQWDAASSSEAWEALASHTGGAERGEALRRAGDQATLAADDENAHRLLEMALAEFRAAGDRRFEAMTLCQIAQVLLNRGYATEAEAHLATSLAVFQESGDRRCQGVTLSLLGRVFRETGRPSESERAYTDAIDILRAGGQRDLVGGALSNLGTLLNSQEGRAAQAEGIFLEALAHHRDTRNRRFEGITLVNLGLAWTKADRFAEAERAFHEAMAILRDIGDLRQETVALDNLGHLYRRTGRTALARGTFQATLAVFRSIGDRRSEAITLANLADAHVAEGRPEEAEACCAEALATFRHLHDAASEGAVLHTLGKALSSSARLEAAAAAFEQADALLTSAAHGSEAALVRCRLALIRLRQGRPEEAERLWREGVEVLRRTAGRGEGDSALSALEEDMRSACARAGVAAFGGKSA
jgi:tetratricopeptide (TPR) repeat protein